MQSSTTRIQSVQLEQSTLVVKMTRMEGPDAGRTTLPGAAGILRTSEGGKAPKTHILLQPSQGRPSLIWSRMDKK